MTAIQKLLIDHVDIWTSAEAEKKSGRGRASGSAASVYGVSKLRELILELAVRGKLLPQVEGDEPASSLLDRILDEKNRISNKLAQKQSNKNRLTDPHHLPVIPNSWQWTTLAAVSFINPRNSIPADIKASFVSMAMIGARFNSRHDHEERKWSEIKQGFTHFANNDIGVAKITPCFENGKACVFSDLANGIGAGTTELYIIRPVDSTLNPRYVLAYLKSPRFLAIGETKMTGTAGQKRLPREFVETNPFPLPPISEQHRIVAKVDELMALCDQLEAQHTNAAEAHEQLIGHLLGTLTQSQDATAFDENWQRIAEHFDILFTTESSIEALKKEVLQLAVMGRLVPQDAIDEPASELVKHVAKNKAELSKKGIHKKLVTLDHIAWSSEPKELPNGWQWTTLGMISLVNPRNVATDDTRASFVSMTMIGAKFNSKHDHEERAWHEIKQGFTHFAECDIGLAKITPCFENSKACVFSGLVNGIGAGTTELHIVRPVASTLDPRYVLAYLKSPQFLAVGETKMTGTAGQKRLPKEFVESHPFPLPPLAEQHRIVAKVDEIMALCDKLQTRITAADRLQQKLADVMVEQATA